MEERKIKGEDIVFSYQLGPVSGKEGDDGGFSIQIYGNGKLKVCTYKFYETINSIQVFKMSRKEVGMVYRIIRKYREELKEVPMRLDNGSQDGEINEFVFFGYEQIVAWNIKTTVPQAVMIKNHTYYQEYKENMKYENVVLKVFREICKYLKKQEIYLDLHGCEVQGKYELKVTL